MFSRSCAPQARSSVPAAVGVGSTPPLFVYPAPTWQLQWARDRRDDLAQLLDVVIEPDWPIFPESLDGALVADPSGWGPYFAIDLQQQRLIGMGGYYGPPDHLGTVEFGYAIAAAARGRGLGHAFATTLLRRAELDPGVRRVDAHTLADGVISEEGFDNLASVAVLRRLGFERIDGDAQSLHWRRLLRD